MHTYKFMNTLPHISDDQMAAYTLSVIEEYERQGITTGISFNAIRCPEHTDVHQAVEVTVVTEVGIEAFPIIFKGQLLYSTMDGVPTEVDRPIDPMQAFLEMLQGATEGGVTNRFSAADLFG